MGERYLVVGRHAWNRSAFDEAGLPASWGFTSDPADLTAERLLADLPRYVFFLHWSTRVPDEVVQGVECVNFHMTALPEGRGGSPLQHLVAAGRTETTLTAHRMVAELDAGPVYLREPLSLEGTAEAIYERSSHVALRMARRIATEEPAPVPQVGSPTTTRRRRPEESDLRGLETLDALYETIRMVDAEGYPHAYLDVGSLRFEFRRAARYHGRVEADVVVTRRADQP